MLFNIGTVLRSNVSGVCLLSPLWYPLDLEHQALFSRTLIKTSPLEEPRQTQGFSVVVAEAVRYRRSLNKLIKINPRHVAFFSSKTREVKLARMSRRYAKWGRDVTQTGVGILLPGIT